MNTLFAFLASPAGRWTRAIAGLALVAAGVLAGSTVGIMIAVIGVVPLAAGVLDFCVFAPLAALPFGGPQLRAALASPTAHQASR